ncbi:conserved hypothetical protein (plasmid) [Rhodococcus jostii RHA1]|uniref:Uncharacterized protein n=1 Tax=Rhodococcus jostii (strain RHA1) TaxID=101510 RepID=Q0RYY2_RHOJR|nr:conserved hypothetical protein [Rhodococcus jostii RHA1]
MCPTCARDIHLTWPHLDGLYVPSPTTGRPNVVLWNPAADSFPADLEFTRPLDHCACGRSSAPPHALSDTHRRSKSVPARTDRIRLDRLDRRRRGWCGSAPTRAHTAQRRPSSRLSTPPEAWLGQPSAVVPVADGHLAALRTR